MWTDYQDNIMTEIERSDHHQVILDLELDAGTDETLDLPFWGGECIFICMKNVAFSYTGAAILKLCCTLELPELFY